MAEALLNSVAGGFAPCQSRLCRSREWSAGDPYCFCLKLLHDYRRLNTQAGVKRKKTEVTRALAAGAL